MLLDQKWMVLERQKFLTLVQLNLLLPNFCELETIPYEKLNKSVLANLTVDSKDDTKIIVNFIAETLTFTLIIFETKV